MFVFIARGLRSRSPSRLRLVGAFALLAAALFGCDAAQPDDGRLRVVVTTGQIEDVVANVAGNRVTLHALMGPGTDPHLYVLSEGDLVRLEQADVIFFNGLHLEAKLADILANLGRDGRRSVAVTRDMPESALIDTAGLQGGHDPHVWFDLELWSQAVATITTELAAADPAGADEYEANSEDYLRGLAELGRWAGSQLEKVPPDRRILVTAHDAFGYFGRAWGFQVYGLQGISTASEAGAGDVQRLANFLTEEKIPAIFIETSVPDQTMRAVLEAARAQGHQVQIGGELFSDALGPRDSDAGTFEGMYRANVAAIAGALGQ
ncbi:MAG: zinc ABC transporter substrate-binding protein [Chloroflexota bacterium]|nr:zinc ABC transporter substrate-binding protein [Chloroflexota bacterium]MDE2862088.1 zinc ABC transporter substrate-binding protein [Chloroflexota bacterium]